MNTKKTSYLTLKPMPCLLTALHFYGRTFNRFGPVMGTRRTIVLIIGIWVHRISFHLHRNKDYWHIVIFHKRCSLHTIRCARIRLKPVNYTDPVHRMMKYHTFSFSHVLFREHLDNHCATIMCYADVWQIKNNIFYLHWTRYWQDQQRLPQGVYNYFGPWNSLACLKARSPPDISHMADKCPWILSAFCVCVQMRTWYLILMEPCLATNRNRVSGYKHLFVDYSLS